MFGSDGTERQRDQRDENRDLSALHVRFPHATVTAVDSMTFRMKPDGFQFGSAGCASPSALVQQTISVRSPFAAGVKFVCHCRKLYLPSSLPSCARLHVFPPSADKSTCLTPVFPPNAMPRTTVEACRCVSTEWISRLCPTPRIS